jgi:hypothetical protein
LPKDLQKIVDKDAAAETVAINPLAAKMFDEEQQNWLKGGGELITLPGDEQSAMMKTLASVGEDVSKPKAQLSAAYHVVMDAAKRSQ